ncbi:MAG: DUF4843 domain-containing protein [Odoribacteraceae bacterium]|jgi:hypothetical protein|nr:DUF4843 domain-containing protein [Odoribacteraceae bacterium]
MKYVITCMLAALFTVGCTEQEIEFYNGQEGVYFYSDAYTSVNLNYVPASRRVEFLRLQRDTVELSLTVMITGREKDYPRQIKIVIDPDSTTAVAGINYEPLADFYTVAAGQSFVDVPLRFYNNANISDNEKRVEYHLLPTDDFVIGIPVWRANLSDPNPIDLTRHAIIVTGTVPSPPAWSGGKNATTGIENGTLGVFSMKKFELICELCHLTYDDWLDANTMSSARLTMVQVVARTYLRQMYEARTPILEDDGRLMWISGVSLWTSIPGVPWDGTFNL